MDKNKVPKIVPLFLLTTVTIVIWASFDIYLNFKKSAPAVVPEDIIAAIDPKLDTTTLNSLAGRYYLNDEEIPETIFEPAIASKASPTPKAKISPTPVASGSAQPTATASATPEP
jgi:hypothetical protein